MSSRTGEICEAVGLDRKVHLHLIHRHSMLGDSGLVGQEILEGGAKVCQFGFRDGGESVQGCLCDDLISNLPIA